MLSGALAVFAGIALPRPVCADGVEEARPQTDSHRVFIAASEEDRALAGAIQAELAARGVAAEFAPSATSGPPVSPSAVVRIEAGRVELVVWTSGAVRARETVVRAPLDDDPSWLPRRVAEWLRVQLFLATAAPSRDAIGSASTPGGDAAGVPEKGGAAGVPEKGGAAGVPEKGGAAGVPEKGGAASWRGRADPPATENLWPIGLSGSLGAGASTSPGGVAGLVVAEASFELFSSWGLDAFGATTFAASRIERTSGSATLHLDWLGLGAHHRFSMRGLVAELGAGASLLRISTRGEPKEGNVGQSAVVLSALPHVRLALIQRLGGRVALRLSGSAGWALPRPVVRFVDEDVASTGRPWLAAALGLSYQFAGNGVP